MDSFLCDDKEIFADVIQFGKMETVKLIRLKLSKKESSDLRRLLGEYPDVFQSKPGKTTLIERRIKTGTAQLIRLPSYRVL